MPRTLGPGFDKTTWTVSYLGDNRSAAKIDVNINRLRGYRAFCEPCDLLVGYGNSPSGKQPGFRVWRSPKPDRGLYGEEAGL